MFGYLKKYHNTEMAFDPSDPVIDESLFERKDWTTSEFGLSLAEALPANALQPRGLGFITRAYVDADHATDDVTRRSLTGFLVYPTTMLLRTGSRRNSLAWRAAALVPNSLQ